MDFILSILQSIGFNWHIALANFINFLIILFILNKFVFKKVFSGIESRQNLIKQGLENASEAEKHLQKAVTESQDIIFNSKKEGEKVFKSIVDKGELEAKSITEKANSDADNLRNNLNAKIVSAESDIQNNFSKIAPELVASLLKKALGNIDEATHNKLIANLAK